MRLPLYIQDLAEICILLNLIFSRKPREKWKTWEDLKNIKYGIQPSKITNQTEYQKQTNRRCRKLFQKVLYDNPEG